MDVELQNRKTFKLHYTVLDSLRSSWREFQALHDLGLNIPLMGEILGNERTFAMATTPPHDAPADATDEGNPFTLSPQTSVEPPGLAELSPPLRPSGSSSASVFDSAGSSAGDNSVALRQPAFSRETSSSNGIAMNRHASSGASSSSSAVTRVQQRDLGAHRLLNRLEVIENVVNSWKMKGCTEKFMRYLRLKYNPSQLHAIHTAVDQHGFTLVQGPPGTGKTSTILGILNAIHIREYNQYYKLALEALLGAEGQQCRNQPYEHPWLKLISRLTSSKPRILVVAPSNTAVDNIVLRIMASGFVDGNGGKYFPNILRLGAGSKSTKIKAISLEDLVEKELSSSEASNNRRDSIDNLSAAITEMIKKIAFLQSMLVNLTTAFHQSAPLPDAFELRVDRVTGQPQWVDHHLRATSLSAPERKLVQVRGPSKLYGTLESLPDYIAYSHQLTQLLGAIESANAKRSKLHAMDTMTSELGAVHVRELAERSCIDGAHILFTTLNSAGHPSMESTEFCVTVVDEAAQVHILSINN